MKKIVIILEAILIAFTITSCSLNGKQSYQDGVYKASDAISIRTMSEDYNDETEAISNSKIALDEINQTLKIDLDLVHGYQIRLETRWLDVIKVNGLKNAGIVQLHVLMRVVGADIISDYNISLLENQYDLFAIGTEKYGAGLIMFKKGTDEITYIMLEEVGELDNKAIQITLGDAKGMIDLPKENRKSKKKKDDFYKNEVTGKMEQYNGEGDDGSYEIKKENVDYTTLSKDDKKVVSTGSTDTFNYLKNEKQKADNIIKNQVPQETYVKLFDQSKPQRVSGDNWMENGNVELVYYVYTDKESGDVIAILEELVSFSGDWYMAMIHFFDEKGEVYATEKINNAFYVDADDSIFVPGEVYKRRLTKYFDDQFNIIHKAYKLTDGKGKEMVDPKGESLDIIGGYRDYATLNSFLKSKNINITK